MILGYNKKIINKSTVLESPIVADSRVSRNDLFIKRTCYRWKRKEEGLDPTRVQARSVLNQPSLNIDGNIDMTMIIHINTTIDLLHNLDFGRCLLVAARTLVNFIARAIFPLILSFPFMNACCGFSSLRTIFIMSLSETFTDKSGLVGAPPAVSLPADGFSDLRSRYHCSLLSEIVNTTLPCRKTRLGVRRRETWNHPNVR
mmetsp:Transcript_10530/g.29613  ORF Transcript_10530/g.29613 Transcript_10530/m.29613 type:complete len:201 (-) Transcript_10530:244-846(-)